MHQNSIYSIQQFIMIQRFWRSKTVTQKPKAQNSTFQQNIRTPINNENQSHLPNTIGCKIIEMQMQIEDGNLTKNLLIQLLQEYTKAVQFYEEKGDERYKMYQKKIHNFLQKEAVDAVLKGRQNIGTMIIKKQKAQQQIRKATNNSKLQVKKLIENSDVDAQKQKNKIQNEVHKQMQSLQKRLENKRSNSQFKKNTTTTNGCNLQGQKLKILSQYMDLPNIPKPKKKIVKF